MCLYECVLFVGACVEKGIGFPESGVKGGCELPDVGTGNLTRVLWKSKAVNLRVTSPAPTQGLSGCFHNPTSLGASPHFIVGETKAHRGYGQRSCEMPQITNFL